MNIGVYASLVRWAKQIRASEDRRTADGKPDFSGLWQGPGPLIALFELACGRRAAVGEGSGTTAP